MRRRMLLVLLALSLLVTGCARRFVLEDLGLALTVGYDLADDGRLLMTMVMPQVSEESQSKFLTITSKGDISKEARENISLSTDRQVVSGQLRTVVFSEKLARQGIFGTMDTLMRDVTITKTLILCVSDGPAKDLLKQQVPSRPSSGRYVYEMLRKEGRNFTVPSTTVHDFFRHYYADGTDPFTPYIRLRGQEIQAAGTALFRDDQFVGSLSTEETKIMLLLSGKGEGGDIKQTIAREGKNGKPAVIMLTFVRTKNKKKIWVTPDKQAHVRFDVDVNGQVIEYTGTQSLTDDKTIKLIETRIEKGLQSRMQDLIDQLQHKYKTDPLGIGDMIRATGYHRPWTKGVWRDRYEHADIKVNFKMNIIRTGLTK